MSPLVSVVLPVRNGEPFITASIESVLHQTVGDLELIVVENGSTDNTAAIVRTITQSDNRVVLIEAGPIGLAAALNTGLDRARGTYVARMDADDVCRPDRLARQVEYLEQHDHVAVVGSQVRFIDEAGRPATTWRVPTSHDQIVASFHFGNPMAHPTVVFAPHRIDHKIRYVDEYPDAEDLALWVELAASHWFANVPMALVDHRVHGGSVSSRSEDGGRSSLAILSAHSPWRPATSRWIHERTFNRSQVGVPLVQFVTAMVVLNAVNLVRPWASRRQLMTRSARALVSVVRRRSSRIHAISSR